MEVGFGISVLDPLLPISCLVFLHLSVVVLAMTDQPLLNIRTTSQLIRQTTTTFSSSFFTFLLLSLALYSFRALIENGTHLLTTFIDRDPSLKPLLSRLDLAGHHHPHHPYPHPHRRRRPFFHLTRVGTLDDDFFSSNDDPDLYLFGSHRSLPPNATSITFSRFDPNLGFSTLVVNNGIKIGEIARSGLQFKVESEQRGDKGEEEGVEEKGVWLGF